MTTMNPYLPWDLVKEIISKVHLRSMRAVRLTCKSWNDFSQTRNFSKMHLAKTTKEFRMMVVTMNHKLYLMSHKVDENLSTELIGLNQNVRKISQVFHCEGLLLCILQDKSHKTTIMVWNPYTGQTRWIEPGYSPNGESIDSYRYSLGYVNSHKILKFIDDKDRPENRYEIYDFDSDLWKKLHSPAPRDWYVSVDQHGVSFKGNTYWCATKSNSQVHHIICFDFTRERFGPLTSLPFNAGKNDYVTLSSFKEEKLAVSVMRSEINPNPYEMEIWITTNIEAENLLWSKISTLDTDPHHPVSPGSYFIDEEKKSAMGFDDLRKLYLRKRAGNNYGISYVCSYVPSLVQIKQPTEQSKRKRQSNFVREQTAGGKRRNNSQF